MPTLGAPLDLAKYEARNLRVHQLGTAPSSPVTGQLYYNTADNTLYWFDGTSWISAKSPVLPDATPSTKGVVQLAGDLAGTAASPQIAAGVITDVDVNAANKDGAALTPSMRTLGLSTGQAMKGDEKLNSIAAPNNTLNLNNQRIVSLADPTGAQDGATKNYVDGIAAGLSWKKPVRLVATTNIGASPPGGPQTIDGVAVATNDRVLLIGQTVPADNGIWGVNTGGTWVRTTDADSQTELLNAAVLVSEGTANSDTGWVCTTNVPITVGTTALTWVQFSGPGEYIAGTGMTLTGKTFDVGGTTNRITVAADSVDISPLYIGQNTIVTLGIVSTGTWQATPVGTQYGGTGASTITQARQNLAAAGYYSNNATHGAGTTITIPASTHGCRATRALIVQVQDNATGNVLLPDVSVAANGDVTVTFGVSQAANSILITVVG